ncbi:hypothetical protein CFP56_008559, partial [Quercus suber]
HSCCGSSKKKHTHDLISNGIPWKTVFAFTIWALWKHRNRVVFENTNLNANLHSISTRQAIHYFLYTEKFLRTRRFRTNAGRDGASLGIPGKVGGGGLIREYWGAWLKGFS